MEEMKHDNQYFLTKILELENEKNHYAMFRFTYEQAVILRYELQQAFNDQCIEDYQFVSLSERIAVAKEKMLKNQLDWMQKTINPKLKTVYTIYSVVNNLFGTDFKGNENV